MEKDIEYIKNRVCYHLKVSKESLQLKTRKREIVQARQTAMYFSKKYTKFSFSTIGQNIGSKNHATVMHACKTMNNLIETDKYIKNQIEIINKILKNHFKNPIKFRILESKFNQLVINRHLNKQIVEYLNKITNIDPIWIEVSDQREIKTFHNV